VGFECDDFRAGVRLFLAGSHPGLKCLVALNGAIRTDDDADGFSLELGRVSIIAMAFIWRLL
jgi:hypothetical protein